MQTYRERLWAPVSWAVIALAGSLLLALSFSDDPVVAAVLAALGIGGLVAVSRDQLRVEDGVLHVPGARAPVTAFGPAEVLDRKALRQRMGVRAERDAWVRVKPWAKKGVLLPVTDPEDDTPYWLVGTRRPTELAVAVAVFPS